MSDCDRCQGTGVIATPTAHNSELFPCPVCGTETMTPRTLPLSGEQIKAALTEAARTLGYLVYSVPDSRRTETGWPDLLLISPGHPDGDAAGRVVIAIETKSRNERLRPGGVTRSGRVMPGQADWLTAIAETAGCQAFVVRPRPEDCRRPDGPWREIDYDTMLTILQEGVT